MKITKSYHLFGSKGTKTNLHEGKLRYLIDLFYWNKKKGKLPAKAKFISFLEIHCISDGSSLLTCVLGDLSPLFHRNLSYLIHIIWLLSININLELHPQIQIVVNLNRSPDLGRIELLVLRGPLHYLNVLPKVLSKF